MCVGVRGICVSVCESEGWVCESVCVCKGVCIQ